jgi:hypothetical protein
MFNKKLKVYDRVNCKNYFAFLTGPGTVIEICYDYRWEMVLPKWLIIPYYEVIMDNGERAAFKRKELELIQGPRPGLYQMAKLLKLKPFRLGTLKPLDH